MASSKPVGMVVITAMVMGFMGIKARETRGICRLDRCFQVLLAGRYSTEDL